MISVRHVTQKLQNGECIFADAHLLCSSVIFPSWNSIFLKVKTDFKKALELFLTWHTLK